MPTARQNPKEWRCVIEFVKCRSTHRTGHAAGVKGKSIMQINGGELSALSITAHFQLYKRIKREQTLTWKGKKKT